MPENSGKPQITIIVVNFNGGEDILACLNSIFHGKSEAEFEVLVVDNGSTDNSLVQIRAQFSSVKLLELGENRGFAAACNEGMKAAQGRAILLLNPDTEVRERVYGMIHEEYLRTRRQVMDIAGIRELLEENPVLRLSLSRRNAYLDPLNHIQLALLNRYRSAPPQSAEAGEWLTPLLRSINAIAAGMRNTG